jgi:hypothetical protein
MREEIDLMAPFFTCLSFVSLNQRKKRRKERKSGNESERGKASGIERSERRKDFFLLAIFGSFHGEGISYFFLAIVPTLDWSCSFPWEGIFFFHRLL